MGTTQRRRAAACVGCLVLFVAVSTSGQQVANKNNPVEWKKFGAQTLQNAPRYIQDASPLVKVQYLAMKVNDEVIRLKITPNDSLLDRGLAAGGSDGTCGDLTNKLASALEGSGIVTADDIGSLAGERSETKPISDPANWDHGTMVVLLDGRPFVFDLWMFAHENGGLLAGTEAFNGFAGSKWNGMPADQWGAELKSQGYRFFRLVDSNEPRGTLDGAIRTLREIGENKRLRGSVAIEEMSSPGPGDIKTFRALIKNPPSFVEYPLKATWTVDGRPVSVSDPNVSTVVTLRSLMPGSHTLEAKISFRNSSTGLTETMSAKRIFAIGTTTTMAVEAGRILEPFKVEVRGDVRYTSAKARAVYTDSDGAGTLTVVVLKMENTFARKAWRIIGTPVPYDGHYEGYRQAKWKHFPEGVRNGALWVDFAEATDGYVPLGCESLKVSGAFGRLAGAVMIGGTEKLSLCGEIDAINGRAWGVVVGVPGFTWQLEWGKGGPEA